MAQMTKKKQQEQNKKSKAVPKDEEGFMVTVIRGLSREIIADPDFKEKARPIVEKALLRNIEYVFNEKGFMDDLVDSWDADDMTSIMAEFIEGIFKDIRKKIKFSIK